MGRVTRTGHASADLDDIWLHVALDNPAAADRLIDRIVARCQDLADHPRLGPSRPEIAPEARILVVGDYLALYRIMGDSAEIVRVVHGARALKALFDIESDRQRASPIAEFAHPAAPVTTAWSADIFRRG